MSRPECCGSCQYFQLPPGAAALAALAGQRPELDGKVHGACRRHAPQGKPLLVLRLPADVMEDRDRIATIQQEIANATGASVCGISNRRQPAGDYACDIQHLGSSCSQSDWCGDWRARGDNVAGVFADWLQEHQFPEAAAALRAVYSQ